MLLHVKLNKRYCGEIFTRMFNLAQILWMDCGCSMIELEKELLIFGWRHCCHLDATGSTFVFKQLFMVRVRAVSIHHLASWTQRLSFATQPNGWLDEALDSTELSTRNIQIKLIIDCLILKTKRDHLTWVAHIHTWRLKRADISGVGCRYNSSLR